MATTTYSWEEIKKHNTADSLWIVIDGNVYDVTKFKDEHPGGEEVLLENGGSDATGAFTDVGHSPDAIELKKNYLIGVVQQSPSSPSPECLARYDRIKAVAKAAIPSLLIAALAIGVGVFIYKKFKN